MGSGSPTVPLWLPYVVFTVVLLSLIVVSFARFHALRGAQYRNSSTHLDTPRLTWTHLDTPRFHALRGAQYRNRQLADERTSGLNGPKNGSVLRIINQSINQSCIFRVVQVIKLLQDPLEVGNNFPGINDNVRERGLEQNCFFKRCQKIVYTNGEF